MSDQANTSNRPKISVVIVSFNTKTLLRECLESLRKFEPSAQMIVVDNASRDGSETIVREEFPEVTVIQSGRNAGFAGANDLGIAKAAGEFVILLNSDTRLEEPALSSTVAWMESRPEIGASSPRLLGADGQPQSCIYAWPSVASLWREALKLPPKPAPDNEGWIAGTCLVLRRAALEEAGGGLDENYGMYWEDADLSRQIVRKGWKVEPFDGATILHYGGASGGGEDAARRPDLHAWYLYGKYRWFRKNEGFFASAAVWLLDAADVPRKRLRAWLRPERKAERDHARVQARALFNALIGRKPPVPGAKKA